MGLFFEKLSDKLNYYAMGVHNPKAETKKILEQLNGEVERIKQIQDQHFKLLSNSMLVESCRRHASYFRAKNTAPDLLAILNKLIEQEEIIENPIPLPMTSDLVPSTVSSEVTIYIWEPRSDGLVSDVGHVAIKTPNRYMSFWPHPDSPLEERLKGVNSVAHTHLEDLRDEGRPPDHKITLHCLNWSEMEAAYDKLQHLKWRAEACDRKGCSDSFSRNCSSFSGMLLVIGGIRDLWNISEEEKNKILSPTPSIEKINELLGRLQPNNNGTAVQASQNPESPSKVAKDLFFQPITDFGVLIGASFWHLGDLLGKKKILPSNITGILRKAQNMEQSLAGERLVEDRKIIWQKKRYFQERIKEKTGIDLKRVLSKAKYDLIQINFILHTHLGKLATAEKRVRDELHTVLSGAQQNYKKLKKEYPLDEKLVIETYNQIKNFYLKWNCITSSYGNIGDLIKKSAADLSLFSFVMEEDSFKTDRIEDGRWDTGYTMATTYKKGGNSHLLMYKEQTGGWEICRFNNDHSLVYEERGWKWDPGYTLGTTYTINHKNYLFMYKEKTGEWNICGYGEENKFYYKTKDKFFDQGFTLGAAYVRHEKQRLFLYNKNTGHVKFWTIDDNQELQETWEQQQWDLNYTLATTFLVGNDSYLFMYKKDSGFWDITSLVGSEIRAFKSGFIDPGYTVATAYDLGEACPYLLLYNGDNGKYEKRSIQYSFMEPALG